MVASDGIRNNRLIESRQLGEAPDLIQSGDIFLNVRVRGKDWAHTGIILSREGEWIHTIEGNTNAGGSREGMEVRQRMWNFMKLK